MSTRQFTRYLDGYYGSPVRISRTPREYPFAALGDTTAARYVATYLVDQATFTPTARGTVDPENAGFYLIAESKPEIINGDLATFTRTYSNVPLQQTVVSSIILSKPSLSGTFPQVFGGFRLFQPDTTLLRFDAYAAQSVTSDSGAPAFYPTGGTYTLSFDGDTTTALAHNAPATTVQGELNALTSVANRGGLTVSGTHDSAGGFSITWNSYATITDDISGLTLSGAWSNNIVSLNSGYTQTINITDSTSMSGTFTLTLFGATTAAINYNASTATAQAAINALSAVINRGRVVVSSIFGPSSIFGVDAYGQHVSFTVQFSNANFTGTASSLTPVGSTISGSLTDGPVGRTQKIIFSAASAVRSLFCAAHGLTTADTLYIKGGSTYYSGIAGNFTLPDANTVAITVSAAAAYAAAGTVTEIGKRTKTQYSPGIASVACRRITDFYLPGVTSGITTADDIPLPVNQSDGALLLLAIFAGTGTINIAVGELTQWRDSPILSLAKTTINAANV